VQKVAINHMHLAKRCSAHCRWTRQPCRSPAVKGRSVCRMHGGYAGAPRGAAHGRYRHGRYTCEAIESKRAVSMLIDLARQGLLSLD